MLDQNDLQAIKETTHSFDDEAKVIMGSDEVSPKKLQGVVEYLKHEKLKSKRQND